MKERRMKKIQLIDSDNDKDGDKVVNDYRMENTDV